MSYYDVGMVCENGHEVNRCAQTEPERNQKFCSDCGAPTTVQCPNCNAHIRGMNHDFACSWRPPHHCHNCGQPYPWTIRRSEALSEVLDELEELDDVEREKLKKSIPDILTETPRSETAVFKFKKVIDKIGTTGSKMLINVLNKVAADAVKSMLGL